MKGSQKSLIIVATLLLFLTAKASIELYRPMLDSISVGYGISDQLARLSITSFLLAFGVGQFFSGYLSDLLGKKRYLIISLLLALFGQIVTSFSDQFSHLIASRVIQGLALSCSRSLGYSMIRDSFRVERMSRIFGLLKATTNAFAILSLLLGAWFVLHLNWRDGSLFLALTTLITLVIVIFFLPMSKEKEKASSSLVPLFRKCGSLFRNIQFLHGLIPACFALGALSTLEIASPSLFTANLHLSAYEYSSIAIGMKVFLIIGAFFSGFAVERLRFRFVTALASLFILCACLLPLAFDMLSSVRGNIAATFLINFFFGFIFSPCSAHALVAISKKTVYAASLMGSLLFISSAIFTSVFSFFDNGSLQSLYIYLACLMLLSFVFALTLGKKIKV